MTDRIPDIYIKAFNRPFHLDRCLQSIRRLVTGYDRLVVLDDGLLPGYRARLEHAYPEAEFVATPTVATHYEASRSGATRRELGLPEPSALWIETIRRGTADYVLVLEEDTWLNAPVDLAGIAQIMRTHDALMCRMSWNGAPALTLHDHERVAELQPPGDPPLTLYLPEMTTDLDRYKLFALALQFFDRHYWVHNFDGVHSWQAEEYPLWRALDYIAERTKHGKPTTFLQRDDEPVRHAWTSSCQRQMHDCFAVIDCLNAAWADGRLDPMAGYPAELPESMLLDILNETLSPAQVAQWRLWRSHMAEIYDDLERYSPDP